MAYADSSKISLFPCISRGDGIAFAPDVEAKLTTEHNISQMMRDIYEGHGSFVVKKEGDSLTFVLGGYHVVLTDSAILALRPLYAHCVIMTPQAGGRADPRKYQELVLVSNPENPRQYLDEKTGEDYFFKGMEFSNTPFSDTYSLQLLDAEGTVPETSTLQWKTSSLANNAITTDKIVDASIATSKIADSAVVTAKIANSNVTTAKLNDAAVTTVKINNSAVTTDKINSGAVTEAKLGTNAVTTDKIKDGNVTNAKLEHPTISVAMNVSPVALGGTIPAATTSDFGVVRVDSSMDSVSTNPVQNKVAKKYTDDAIAALDVPSTGSNGSYLKTISEVDGKISATTQTFDTTFNTPSDNNAPTTKLVKDTCDGLGNRITAVGDRIDNLDLEEVGEDGKYIKYVSQSNGLVSARTQAFDTSLTSATNKNAPTSKTVKDYVDTAINNLDITEITNTAGKTIQKITETDGKVSASFQNISINSGQINDLTDAYSSSGTVAVTGKAVAAALATLDVSAQGGGDSQYIKSISETDGKINATVGNCAGYIDPALAQPPTASAVYYFVNNRVITPLRSAYERDSKWWDNVHSASTGRVTLDAFETQDIWIPLHNYYNKIVIPIGITITDPTTYARVAQCAITGWRLVPQEDEDGSVTGLNLVISVFYAPLFAGSGNPPYSVLTYKGTKTVVANAYFLTDGA